MLPLPNWKNCSVNSYLSSIKRSCSHTTAHLLATVHQEIYSTPLRLSSRARDHGKRLRGPASTTASLPSVTDADEGSPALNSSRKAATLRPRLQRASPASPHTPSSRLSTSPPQQQQQALLRTGAGVGPRVGLAVPRPRSAEINGATPGEEVKSAYGANNRQMTPALGRQLQQTGNGAAGRGMLQPRHTGFELKTGLALTWLGTNSGTPTLERNVSCTLVRLPGAVQMVDCGEGTHRQLLALEKSMDLAEIDGIFITHLHGDHCFGVAAALAVLDRAKAAGQSDPARRRHHLYGPPGLSELVRVSMVSTGLTQRLELPILVSELVTSPAAAHPPQPLALARMQRQQRRRQPNDEPNDAGRGGAGDGDGGVEVLLQRVAARRVQDAPELTAAVQAVQPRVAALEEIWSPPRYPPFGQYGQYGRGGPYNESDNEIELSSSGDEDNDDIAANGGGGSGGPGGAATPFRQSFVAAEGLFWELPGCAGVRVRAAQLQHRVPCWGYVFTEAMPYEEGMRRRKVVVLGDTVSSKPIAPLAAGCDVISHEATFARGMEGKARIAQHSTGWMAGAFAAAVGARNLVLTHFSARYREGPREVDLDRSSRNSGHQEVEAQSWAVAGLLKEAVATYGRPEHLFAATDFYTHHVPPRPLAASGGLGDGIGFGASRR
ncbi:hypothetical protein Vretimale_14606 [Volvox reticuliferus]|uniref:Metallo-beta-lactamase domain-containing protein n=1 Tax=Volvox reticuliferus TaxID=1737510 RepID=A0A8J4LUS2_9CHLO|nr:hypothetical protein Vretifemale_13116 [Volvox reticuliferus]GIM11022.1 hypothetical protein Vretimale_14606 [Volvox reticuliferus]